MVIDVYMSESHPVYQVWVDGKIYDEMTVRDGFSPLTQTEQDEIANNYREALAKWSLDI